MDPVGDGYVESLARPGRNVTGFAAMELSVIGKMLEILTGIASGVTRVAIVYNPDNPSAIAFARSFEAATVSLGIEPIISRIHGIEDIEHAIEAVAAQPNGGLFFPLDVTLQTHLGKSLLWLRDFVCRRFIRSAFLSRVED